MSDKEIVSLNARISRELKNTIKIMSIKEDTTMQELFEELLWIGLKHYDEDKKSNI